MDLGLEINKRVFKINLLNTKESSMGAMKHRYKAFKTCALDTGMVLDMRSLFLLEVLSVTMSIFFSPGFPAQ